MKKDYKIELFNVNLMFLLVALLLVSLGGYIQQISFDFGIIFTQYLVILLPPLLYLRINNKDFRSFIPLEGAKLKDIFVVALIIIFSYPIAIILNFIGIILLEKYAKTIESPIPPLESMSSLFKYIFLIGITPGICEEILFRGFLLPAYSIMGKKRAILITAFLFGIFHFNLQNFLGPMYMGIVLGLIVWKTNSIYLSIMGHALNNIIALLLAFKVQQNNFVVEGNVDIQFSMSKIHYLIVILILLVCIKIVKGLLESLGDSGKGLGEDTNVIITNNLFINIVPIALVIFLFIYLNSLIFF